MFKFSKKGGLVFSSTNSKEDKNTVEEKLGFNPFPESIHLQQKMDFFY